MVSLVAPGACCGPLAGGRADRTGPAAVASTVSLVAPGACCGFLIEGRADRTGPAAGGTCGLPGSSWGLLRLPDRG